MTRTAESATGYLGTAGLTACLVVAATLGLNALVDPYRIVGAPAVSGFNVVKPRAQQRRVEGKRLQVARVAPRTVVLGNSRAEVGLDPESREWPSDARPVYNLALPGTGIGTARAELGRLLAVHRPDRIVVGVEFVDFLTAGRAPAAPAREREVGPWDDAQAIAGALFSVDALADSLRTVGAQRDRYAPDLTALGFNPMREYVRYAAQEGYFGLFRQRYLESRRDLARLPRSIRNEQGVSPELAALEALLAAARPRGIRVDLFTYPYHATQLLLFDDLGLWAAFDSWKRELGRTAGRHPDVAMLDFAVMDDATRQPIPTPDARPGESPWYWEAGHFKSGLGDRMLRQLAACTAQQACENRLPPDGPSLEAHLARQRQLLEAYRRDTAASRAYKLLTHLPRAAE